MNLKFILTYKEALFFSEYVEGTLFNKTIEFYNPKSVPIDLSDYAVKYYTDSSGVVALNFVLSSCATTIPAKGNPIPQASFGTDVDNSEWIVYPQNTISNLGSYLMD